MKCLVFGLFLSTMTIMLLATCGTPSAQNPAGGEAKFATLAVDRFDEMTRQAGNVVLDVRTADEFAQGHLHGAVNIDVNAPDFAQKVGALNKKATYLVLCRSGRRSEQACTTMAGLGFSRLYNLDGGISAWTASGKPVEK